MAEEILMKTILTIVGFVVTGLLGYFVAKIKSYKEKSYTEEDLLLFIYDLRKENARLKDKIEKIEEWLKYKAEALDTFDIPKKEKKQVHFGLRQEEK